MCFKSKKDIQVETDNILSGITKTDNPDLNKISRRVLKRCIHETTRTVVGNGHPNLIKFNKIFKDELKNRNDKIFLYAKIIGITVTGLGLLFRIYIHFD